MFPNTKWRKRKRESSNLGNNSKRPKPEDEDEDDEDVEDEAEIEEDDDLHPMEATPNTIDDVESEVLSGGGNRISDFPKVIEHTVNRFHSTVISIVQAEKAVQYGDNRPQNIPFLENISYGQFQALPVVPADSPSLVQSEQDGGSSSSSSYVCTPPTIMEGRGVVKRYGNNQTHIVPMHADWFSPNSVNRLERQVVPHFFSGKSSENTPEKYMECRNRIVAKYMENPEQRLLVNDCQGLVPGVDLHDLNRIVRFLDHWGIINYSAPAPNREPRLGAPYLREDQNGDIQIHSAALKSIYSLIHFDKPKSRIRPEDICTTSPLSPGNEIADLDSRIRERLSENHCNYCSRPLPHVHYQSQKEVDVMLCMDCFHEGRFVVGHSSIDFVRMNSTKDFCDFDGDNWTDQETLLLLEALEIYNDNWNDIAEHVGSKSKAQCILHFIRLPMEDGLLENIEIPNGSIASDVSSREEHGRPYSNSNGDSARQCFQDLDSESRLPFANSGNPVMALVAFVSSTLGPRVASACAHASLAALSKEDHQSVEGSVNVGRTSVERRLSREGDPHGSVAGLSHLKESLAAQGPFGENRAHSTPLSSESVKNAAKLGLAAAAMKAKQFADHEEREIQRMTASIINHQLRKLEVKLKQFGEVETLLMKECEQVEKVRQRLAAERVRIKSTGFVPSRANTATTIPGVVPSALANNSLNNRQPAVSVSPTQTNIPGYGANQPTHPQMSFMPRQSMFSFGPRLPLSAIHPSSSGPSASAMFNTVPSNNTPNLGHPMLKPVSGTNTNVG
ncbi:hypothetical protein AQUCO_01400264v1 [Aquilegia coerulea]|uniref:SWI/SNF complex subunit SWI3C n=1 Tax=Aquilegia coerulea TaxID=218851 RepID=A0A2G5DVG9_AQUCA|nr:hypothetical protein AQUCO_01400264v1 [Aquilegia coerulea]